MLSPFLKWAGGKRQLLPEIKKYLPQKFNTYFEPFLGAGAVLLAIQPANAVVNDINPELVNCYKVIKNNLPELFENLKQHKNEPEYFYKIRGLDRNKDSYINLSEIEKASRIIYLNKTCYNGLFRVNLQGQFNVPFGRYKNPRIVNQEVLTSINEYLNSNKIQFLNTDFEKAVEQAKKDDFVYFDPPYDPVSETSSFTGYAFNGFGKNEQVRLKETIDKLTDKGCKVILSNSKTEFITDLYKEYRIITVSATRNINSVADKRGKIKEVLVLNY